MLRQAQTLVGKDDRLSLTCRKRDQSSLVQAVHDLPSDRLPRAISFVKSKVKQRERSLVNFMIVELHGAALLADGPLCRSPEGLQWQDGQRGRPEDAGVSEAEPRGGVFQSGLRVFGGNGHWAGLHASASGARKKERAYLLLAGQPSGGWRQALSGGAARAHAVGAQCGSHG